MPQINILVVDDEKEIAELVEIYLVSDGYKVFKAYNAEEGLKILSEEEIHLVLLDVMMPGMNGLELCRKIRESSNIPVIMLSAKSEDLDKIVGLTGGADDYVTKPFNPLELTARVKSQLRRYTQLNPNAGIILIMRSISEICISIRIIIRSLLMRKRLSLPRLNSTFSSSWRPIPERFFRLMRSLRRSGTKRYMKQTTP